MEKSAVHFGMLGSTLGILVGLILSLFWLPGILAQAQHVFESLPNLIGSLEWGWYSSAIGMSLILMAGLFRLQPG